MAERHTTVAPSRRRFLKATGAVAAGLVLGVGATGSVAADASNNPAMPGRIYADDRTFVTRGVTELPAPTNNEHSFDELYVFDGDTAQGQLAVAEAAPGERDFNGGRWSVTVVQWADDATPVLLTNDEVLHQYERQGQIEVLAEGARYFECPLIPLKD
jgi:hypothetical protein